MSLSEVYDYLVKLEQDEKGPYYYFFNCESDSSMTKFEELSNEMKICVKAKSTEVGEVLLSFLRMKIDDNYEYLNSFYDDDDEKTLKESINFLSANSYEKHKDGDTIENVNISDVKIYDIKSLKKFT
jgi:hypothetical protein